MFADFPSFVSNISTVRRLVAPLTIAADQGSNHVFVSMNGGQMKSRVTLKSPKTDVSAHSAAFTDRAGGASQQIQSSKSGNRQVKV